MSHQIHPVRRSGKQLGMFSSIEIRSLHAKGRLQSGDEVGLANGGWQPIDAFLKSLPLSQPAPSSAMSHSSGYFVIFKGQRHGPLELSKIKAMVDANLLDSTAQLESVSSPGHHLSISSVVPNSPSPPVPTPNVMATSSQPGAASASFAPAAVNSTKSKGSYVTLWWQTTLWIYLIMALLGFLSYSLGGLAAALGAGLILAPIKGAFWAWIIWLFRK